MICSIQCWWPNGQEANVHGASGRSVRGGRRSVHQRMRNTDAVSRGWWARRWGRITSATATAMWLQTV